MPQPSTVKISDLNPNPREGETPDQARIRAAGAYAELSNPTPREGETPEDAQKRARGAQVYAEAVNYASAAKAPAPPEAPKQDRGAVEAVGQGVSDVAKTVAGDMSSSELASRQEDIARELVPAPSEKEKEPTTEPKPSEQDGAVGLIGSAAKAVAGAVDEVRGVGEPPVDPATEYERRLAEIAKYGAEAQAELASGEPDEVFADKMQQLQAEHPIAALSGNPLWWLGQWATTGWPASEISPGQQYTDRQWRALYQAYQKAESLPSALNDPKVREDSVFSQQDLYNLVVKSGTTNQNTFSAAQAWGQLKDRYVNNHRNANLTTDQLRALEQTAGAWATDALLSTRTFGGLMFPVEDLPTFRDEQFRASWSDLIPWPNEEGETWESASSKAVKAQEEIGRVLTPKVEQLPGGAVWQQEGPWDYVFRLEQIPLTVVKEAVTNGTMTPELSDVLRGTQNMESFITEVVEDPDWQRQIQDPSAGVRARAWMTLLAAGGVDILFPTFIPLVGSASRFSKEIKLATEVYREVLAEAKAGETMASVTEKAAARLAAMGKAADELEAVRALKAEVAGYRQGFKGKGSELRAAWRESEEALAAKRAETARLAEAAAREEKVRAQTAEAFGDVDEVEDALVTANKIENKSIKADYLARVARNLASDVDVAAFFRKLPELKRILGVPSVIGEVRALGGLSELGKVRDEIGALLEAKRAERAGVEAEYKVIRQRLKNLLKQADTKNVGAELGRIRQEAQPIAQEYKRLNAEVLELESSLAGANKYEAGYARASREEARRWSEVIGSGSEAIPSVMRTSGGEAIPVEPTPIPDVPAPVIENVTQPKQVEALLGAEDLDDLKNLKGVGAEGREGLADILLDGVEIPKGVSKRTVLERALAFSDEELDAFAAELDDLALQAGGRDPYGALGLPEGENVYDAAAEMVRANLANADLPEEELAEVTQAAKLLPLLLGQNWSRSVSRAANEQQVVRFGSKPADWTYRTAGEWYSLPGAYLVSVPNEMLAPIPKQNMWHQYVDRKNYAVRNYIKSSPDFATWVGAQGVDGAKTLSANIDNLRSVGADEAPTWNAYFRRQVAKYGASESGLTPDHILTGDMVWVPNSPRAAGSLKGVEVPGMATRYQGSGTRQTVLEVTQTGQTVPHHIPQDFASVQATVQTGFAARVRGVAANGDVELEILTFSAREGAPRPRETGRIIRLSGSELEFMERGRVPAKPNEPLGAMRPKNAAELKQVQGVDGVRYSGDSADYLTGEWAPPIDYTHEDQFRVYMGDLISMYGRKWKSVVRNLGGQTPSAVPIPRLLPGEKEPGGGWAAGKTGVRHPQESAAHSLRKGYVTAEGTVAEGGSAAAYMGWRLNPNTPEFNKNFQEVLEDMQNPESLLGKKLTRTDLREYEATGRDIPQDVLEAATQALNKIAAREYSTSEVADIIYAGGAVPVPLSGNREVLFSLLVRRVGTDSVDVMPLSEYKRLLQDDAWSAGLAQARDKYARSQSRGISVTTYYAKPEYRDNSPSTYFGSLFDANLELAKRQALGASHRVAWKRALEKLRASPGGEPSDTKEFVAAIMPLFRDELRTLREEVPASADIYTDAFIDALRAPEEEYIAKVQARAERQRIGAEHLKRKEAASKAREARRAAQAQDIKLATEAGDIEAQKRVASTISSEITKSSEIGKKAMLDVVEAQVTGGKLSEDQGLALSLIIERLPEKVARNIVLQVFDDVGGAPAGFTNVKYKTSMKSGRLVTLVGLGVPSPDKALEVGVILAHEFTHAMMPHLPEELLAELRQAYARHKKNQAKSLLSRFLKPRYKDDSERFEEWLAWVVSDYVTRKKLPEQAANIASKAKGDSKKKWDTLERVFNSVRDATKNFLNRIIKGDIGETDKSVRQFVNDWYSADPKVRAQFNDKLVSFYGDLKRSQEEEISAAYKARVEANATEREMDALRRARTKEAEAATRAAEARLSEMGYLEREAERKEKAVSKAAAQAERLRIQAEDDLAQEGKLQSLLIDQARRKRFRGLVEESKAANPEKSAYEHEMRAYLQVVREELKAAGQAAKEALKGTDLRHAQQDYAQAREAIMAAKDLRRKILTLLKEDVQPRLEEQLTGLKSYAAEKKAFRAENLKVPERPSMYRPPLTPVESQVADRVASEMGRVGSYAQAPMTNTLLSRLAEGWAVHHGNAAQTADHALVKLLKYKFPHKASFSDVATFMLRELGLEVNAGELITALRQMDAKAAGLLPAEVDHFADLQRLAKEAKVEGSVDQQKVNEVLTLLQEQAWKSRSETVRMPGRHSLERTMQGLQAKEEFYRKASLKGVPSAVRRFEGFIKAYLTPAREHMDASMRKGLKDLARSFDVRSNKVNELLVAVARKNPQPNDFIRAIENELPGAQKAWFDSSQGGTMSSELFDELLKSYFNPANVTPSAEELASLRKIVIDGTRNQKALTKIADELYEATMKFVRAANAEHKVEAEIARVQGDAAFAKIFATQVLFHQSIRDSLGLGAVVDASSMAKIVSWSTSDYRSASGMDFIQNVIENPLKYQSALDLDLADTVTLGLWSKLTGPERGGVSKAEDLEQLAQAHARVFSEPSLEAAKSKADQVVTKAKPFLTKAALRHYNAQINEALNVSKGAARLDMSVYKQLLTVGLLDASAGVVHHLGNTFGDTARIASELGFRQAWNSLRDSLPSHIILTPFFTSTLVLAKNLPLPEALKALKTQMGDTKFGQWFGNVMSYISRHPDVHVILEGDLTKVYKDAKGREWTHAEILEMAQRYGVPESFALDQIKRVVDDYLKKVANNRGQVPTRLRNAITLLSDVPRDAAAYLGQQRRMALALSLLDDGYDLEKAMSTSSRVLLDYKHDLHPVDRMILVNLLLPFWSFSKTNAAAVARLALTPSAWDGATIRYERSLEKGTQILSQYLTHDGRDEYGMCDVDMPPEQYQKWVKFRDSLRERGVSYDEFVHMINFGVRGGILESIKIQNKPVPEPTVWMAVEAKKFGFEQGEWDAFVLEYFVPDPSRASLPSHFQERAAVFWNMGRGEAAKKIASQVGNDAYAVIPTPASPNRDAVNLFASTAVVGIGSFAVALDFLDSTIQSLQTPGWENDPDVVAQVSLLEQNKRMVEENLQRVLGDPERNAFVNATGSFVGMRPNYPAAPVPEDLAAVLPETWIQARQEIVNDEYITTYSVKPEYSAMMDALLATGVVLAIPSLIRFINPKHDRFLRDPANTGGDMFSFATQVLPYLGLKAHTVSASRNLRQAEYDAAKLTEERMQFAGSNSKAPNLSPAQIGAMERERGNAVVRSMSLDKRKIVARRIVAATSSPGKHEYEMPISPIGRALLVMDYGLPPEEVDQMSNEEVFARLATLTGK